MGKKETLYSANSSILIIMAVSAARLLGSSVLFQVNHEAALLWVSPMVLLLFEAVLGQVPPQVVLLSLVLSCHFFSARLHLHTKKGTLEKGPH